MLEPGNLPRLGSVDIKVIFYLVVRMPAQEVNGGELKCMSAGGALTDLDNKNWKTSTFPSNTLSISD